MRLLLKHNIRGCSCTDIMFILLLLCAWHHATAYAFIYIFEFEPWEKDMKIQNRNIDYAKTLQRFWCRFVFPLCLLSFVLFHFIFTVQCHSNSFRTFVWVIFTRHCYFRLVAFGIIPEKSRSLQTESSMQIHYYNSFNLLYKRVYMLIFPWIFLIFCINIELIEDM